MAPQSTPGSLATGSLTGWSTRAVNLDEHANNPIHTDAGAQAAGFDAAIVAGTTIYGYLTRPAATAWGEAWLTGGGGELRLRKAVLDDELVECRIAGEGGENGDPTVEACVGEEVRATFDLWPKAEAPAMRRGEDLPTIEVELTEDKATYGTRTGDDLALYAELGTAHPALWPNLANSVFTAHLISGAWVHTRSKIYHQDLPSIGEQLTIRSTVVDRFDTRAGSRAVVDIAITAGDRPMARLEHEALVSLR